MAVPQLLNDIINTLLALAAPAALISLVLAGISLRREGGTTFLIGASFTKWMFWSVLFLTLTPLLSWFSSFGVGGDEVPQHIPPAAAMQPVGGNQPLRPMGM